MKLMWPRQEKLNFLEKSFVYFQQVHCAIKRITTTRTKISK
jgi:hypothetical protein